MSEHRPTGFVVGVTRVECQVCEGESWPCEISCLETERDDWKRSDGIMRGYLQKTIEERDEANRQLAAARKEVRHWQALPLNERVDALAVVLAERDRQLVAVVEMAREGIKEGLSHLDWRYSDARPGQHSFHAGEAIAALEAALEGLLADIPAAGEQVEAKRKCCVAFPLTSDYQPGCCSKL
jgi:hypothetical protein